MTVENLQMFAEKPKAYSNSRPNYAKRQIEEVFENAKKKMEVKWLIQQVKKLLGIKPEKQLANQLRHIIQTKNILRNIDNIWVEKLVNLSF